MANGTCTWRTTGPNGDDTITPGDIIEAPEVVLQEGAQNTSDLLPPPIRYDDEHLVFNPEGDMRTPFPHYSSAELQ